MLDVTIYDNKGCRHFIDHVAQITSVEHNIFVTTITDFNDHITRTFHSDEVEHMTMRVMK